MSAKPIHILFMVPYPMKHAPSQRFRVELFLPELDKAGIQYSVQSFLDEETWTRLYEGGGMVAKLWGVIKGFARRWKIILFGLSRYEFVFIHREAAPLGPPLFEWIIRKVFRKKIIYDFDDAIWIPNTSSANRIVAWFKAFWKVKYICRWSWKVTAGNNFLSDFAKRYNKKVIILPTCVDTVNGHNQLQDQHTDKVVIGWTGSHSTILYLDMVLPVIAKLEKKYNFEFVVIANKDPAYQLSSYRFILWKENSEVKDLLQIHIGLMPLQNDPWCEGKCGFKLIQYLSLGIPSIASPVGVNKAIVENNVNGYICNNEEDWEKALIFLIENEDRRKEMGKKGRAKIETKYSLVSQKEIFLELFK